MIQHAGNQANQIQFEEHDGENNAKRVTLVGAVGQATVAINSNVTVTPVGLHTLAPSPSFIGLVTVGNTVNANVSLSNSISNIGFATVRIGTNVNTNIGLVTVDGGRIGVLGNVTLSDPRTGIGLVSVFGGKISIDGNVTLSDSKTYIGLTTTTLGASPAFIGIVTVIQASSSRSLVGNVTLDDGSLTGLVDGVDPVMKGSIASVADGTYLAVRTRGNSTIVVGNSPNVAVLGNVTLSDSKGFIGLTTTTLGASPAFVGIVTVANPSAFSGNISLNPSAAFIGIVTVANPSSFTGNITLDPGSVTGLGAGVAFIGHATVRIATNVNTNIGLVTVSGGLIGVQGNVTLSDSKTYIGLNTVTAGLGDRFIGLVTAVTRNAGTNKALKILPVLLSTNSAATVVVPSNTFYITSILLSSNATVRLNVRSGATYLTGNASLGINIFPGGGWVETGSVDSPVYQGLAAAAPIVIEKFDAGGIISQIGGKVVYFDE